MRTLIVGAGALAASAVSGQTPRAGPQWVTGLAPLLPQLLAYDKRLCASKGGFTLRGHAGGRARPAAASGPRGAPAAAAAGVSVEGAKVHVIGAGFQSRVGIGPALSALPADGPAVVLYHYPYPDAVPAPWARRVDLMCAGHVHGGQVALPFYGALLTLSKYGKKYERGLYRTDEGFPMYVSRGVGLEGNAPRVRFCARPEVALIELVPRE